jgi:glycosyltransferase involved in cell wall biosynthesis
MPEAVFTGHRQGEELSQIYASSDILLFPSTTETFGNVVLEGLSSGIPAIVADVGGCAEIIRKSGGGIIVPASEPERFYEATLGLINNPAEWERLQRKGLEYASRQSWDRINDELIRLYYELVQRDPVNLRP